jgi:hypothetical protein
MSENRWEGFTLNELQELRAGLVERVDKKALADEVLSRARRLESEISQAMREHPQTPSYRGPGVYENDGGKRYEVLGTIGDVAAIGEAAKFVLRVPGDASGVLMLEQRWYFEGFDVGGRRRWTYVEPLEERPMADEIGEREAAGEAERARRLNEEMT